MSSQSTRPASRTGQRFPLRKPGSEATKPKPGPAPRKPVAPKKPAVPPTYEQQDAETGSQDGEAEEVLSSLEEEAAENEVPQVQAPKSKVQAQARPKASKFPSPSKEKDAFTAAPHLALLDLVSDYKPTPPRPSQFVEVHIDFRLLMHMHSAMSGTITHSKAIHKEIPTYNSVFSRLAVSLLATYKILVAREYAQVLTYDEAKVLKKFRLAHDFEAQTIPGPLVAFFSAFGLHVPTDKRYESICPRLPFQGCEDASLDLSKTYISTSPLDAAFPHFPSLLYLAHLVASGEAGTTVKDDFDEDVDLHWQGRFFVLVQTTDTFKDRYRIANVDVKAVATRVGTLRAITQNAALVPPFPDRKDWLLDVHNHLSIRKVPHWSSTDTAAPDLLSYFGVKTDVRWISTIMSALDDEARFFTGNSTLANIGFETGANALCIYEHSLANTAVDDGWFPDLHTHSNEHTVVTTMEDVSDGMMSIATATAVLTKYTGGAATNYANNFASVSVPALNRGELSAYNGHVKRIIRGVHTIEHRFVNHVKTHHLLNVAEVLGSL